MGLPGRVRRVHKKGFLFSLAAIFIVVVALLYFQIYLRERSYDRSLEINENKFITYDEFSEDLLKKYFETGIRLSVTEAIISSSQLAGAGLAMTNISANISEAIRTGNISHYEVLDSNHTFFAYLNRTHLILGPARSYYFNFSNLKINQSDWQNFTVTYDGRYRLDLDDMSFSDSFSGEIVIPSFNVYRGVERIKPTWVENDSLSCTLNLLDVNYICGSVNGTSDPFG